MEEENGTDFGGQLDVRGSGAEQAKERQERAGGIETRLY